MLTISVPNVMNSLTGSVARVRSTRGTRRRTIARKGPPPGVERPGRVLTIFLSHKLGASAAKAKRIAAALSVLAAERMKVIYSANFERGDSWEADIRVGLERADWFIFLYEGPGVNHDWMLYEAGWFRARMAGDSNKKLICLHDPRHDLPAPLRGFASVPARDEELKQLFQQMY